MRRSDAAGLRVAAEDPAAEGEESPVVIGRGSGVPGEDHGGQQRRGPGDAAERGDDEGGRGVRV